MPEMIGSVVGVYNGKTFINVEVKPEMIGHYLAEFSISYSPVSCLQFNYTCFQFTYTCSSTSSDLM